MVGHEYAVSSCVEINFYVILYIYISQKIVPCLPFSLIGLEMEHVYNFNVLGLIINWHYNCKPMVF